MSEKKMEHIAKWFCCHPCYLAQMLRASKMILAAKNGTLSSIGGAPAEAGDGKIKCVFCSYCVIAELPRDQRVMVFALYSTCTCTER